jgi:hypothetical protein
MILYLKDPKKSTQKLDTISSFSNLAGYKINIKKKSRAFLYTNNEHTEKEYKKTITFTIASKKLNT